MRVIAGTLLTLLGAAAQTPDASIQFEVTSIKPSPPGATSGRMSGGPGTKDPGLFTCENVSLKTLVVTAYNLLTYRLSGPDWMGPARFNISAKIPDGTTSEQFRLMLQNLLIDRFKMTLHWEKKEIQTYDLVVAKSGQKMTGHKMKESAPAHTDDAAPPPRPAGEPKADAEGFPILPPGRQAILMEAGGGHVAMRWADETMDRFAVYLSAQLRQPVNDLTGLKGKYDFTMRWVMEGSIEDTAPTLVRAVQEQLGLKLEQKKGMVDILVVDHLEKTPAEN
jgi:uncharacterized protein (TIGR03435 family)